MAMPPSRIGITWAPGNSFWCPVRTTTAPASRPFTTSTRAESRMPSSMAVRWTVLSAATTKTNDWLPSANTASSGTVSACGRSASVTATFPDMPACSSRRGLATRATI